MLCAEKTLLRLSLVEALIQAEDYLQIAVKQ